MVQGEERSSLRTTMPATGDGDRRWVAPRRQGTLSGVSCLCRVGPRWGWHLPCSVDMCPCAILWGTVSLVLGNDRVVVGGGRLEVSLEEGLQQKPHWLLLGSHTHMDSALGYDQRQHHPFIKPLHVLFLSRQKFGLVASQVLGHAPSFGDAALGDNHFFRILTI